MSPYLVAVVLIFGLVAVSQLLQLMLAQKKIVVERLVDAEVRRREQAQKAAANAAAAESAAQN